VQRGLSLACLGASLAICAVIVVLNASFWGSIGNEDRARIVFTVGAVAVDVMKVTLLPLAALAVARQLRTAAITAVGLWVLLTGFSLFSAWSFAQRNSGVGAAELAALGAELKEKQRQLQQAEGELAALPKHRSEKLAAIELKSLDADPKFQLSRQCTEVAAQTRQFCAAYRRLVGEREVAALAAALELRLQALRDAVRGLETQVNRLRFGNPASAFERAFHWAEGEGWIAVNMVVIAVFEIAAGAGVYLALRIHMAVAERSLPPEPPAPWRPVPRSTGRRKTGGVPVGGLGKGRTGVRGDGVDQ